MLGIQIRHARLWFAGEAQNWNLAAFEIQELKEAFDAVVEQNPEHAIFQPDKLSDILPAMTNAPIKALRDAVDHSSKPEFEKAFDALSAGVHRLSSRGGQRLSRHPASDDAASRQPENIARTRAEKMIDSGMRFAPLK